MIIVSELKLDDLDMKILNELQIDCRQSLDVLSKKLGVPKSTIYYRIRKLEESGVIQGYYAKVNPKVLGHEYFTVTLVKAKYGPGYHRKVGEILAKVPGVWAVYYVLGDYDFIVIARAKSREEFVRNILEKFINLDEIERTNTITVVEIFKEDTRVLFKETQED